MTSDIDPKALALNLPELVYEALRFANFAAGEGLCAPEDQALARDPDLFLSEYTDKSGDDDWDTMPARIRDALAAFLREAVSGPKTRPLDLPTMLKHALESGNAGLHWLEYDPTHLPVYRRLALALGAPLPAPPAAVGVDAWRPISEAKKDGTIIWAKLRDDIYPVLKPMRDDLERWNGVQVPLRHPGLADDGFDIGWGVAAPVGHGGFPDEWIEGFMPLPTPPARIEDAEEPSHG